MKNRINKLHGDIINASVIQQGAIRESKKRNFIDILKKAFTNRLTRRSSDLNDIISTGGAQACRKNFKAKIRSKVWDVVDEAYADEKIVEEVTERIFEVAENDPYYRKMFSEDK